MAALLVPGTPLARARLARAGDAIMHIIRGAPQQRKSPITREALQTVVFQNANLRKRIREHESELLDAAEQSRAALAAINASGDTPPPAKRLCA